MNLGQVVFGFFVLLAATLNIGFFVGASDDEGRSSNRGTAWSEGWS